MMMMMMKSSLRSDGRTCDGQGEGHMTSGGRSAGHLPSDLQDTFVCSC